MTPYEDASSDVPRVAMQLSRGVVVASIQVDLDEAVLARFQEDLLQRVHASGARGVVLDVSGLALLDSTEFAALRRIVTMLRLLGAEAVVAGLRPGVVSALIDAGAEVEDLSAALDLDAAFALLLPPPEASEEGEPEVADDEEPVAGDLEVGA